MAERFDERDDEDLPYDERSLDGPGGDSAVDPAMQPVIEAGGGVAEGFEQAEADLVEHASHGDQHAARLVVDDAGEPEELDPGVYGEADQAHSSEDLDDDR
jgi:hypothetical protein